MSCLSLAEQDQEDPHIAPSTSSTLKRKCSTEPLMGSNPPDEIRGLRKQNAWGLQSTFAGTFGQDTSYSPEHMCSPSQNTAVEGEESNGHTQCEPQILSRSPSKTILGRLADIVMGKLKPGRIGAVAETLSCDPNAGSAEKKIKLEVTMGQLPTGCAGPAALSGSLDGEHLAGIEDAHQGPRVCSGQLASHDDANNGAMACSGQGGGLPGDELQNRLGTNIHSSSLWHTSGKDALSSPTKEALNTEVTTSVPEETITISSNTAASDGTISPSTEQPQASRMVDGTAERYSQSTKWKEKCGANTTIEHSDFIQSTVAYQAGEADFSAVQNPPICSETLELQESVDQGPQNKQQFQEKSILDMSVQNVRTDEMEGGGGSSASQETNKGILDAGAAIAVKLACTGEEIVLAHFGVGCSSNPESMSLEAWLLKMGVQEPDRKLLMEYNE